MGKDMEQRVARFLEAAVERSACAATADRSLAEPLRRRVARGEVVSPLPRLWAPSSYWGSLNPAEQTLHMIRGLHNLHPDWVFAGTSAAALHGLSVSWGVLRPIRIVGSRSGKKHIGGAVLTLRVDGDEATVAGGVPVTSLPRTALDCARTLELRDGLAVVDSMLATRTVGREEFIDYVDLRGKSLEGAQKTRLAAELGSDRSGSGGESIARAAMFELGFAIPELQERVVDPVSGASFFVDFCWRLPNGALVYGELDGGEKYLNPSMTQNRGAVWKMRRERIRESRLTAVGGRVMRFSLEDVRDDARFSQLLEAFGIPRVREPIVRAVGWEDDESVPIEAYGIA